MSSLNELEKQFNDSVAEAEASFKKREGVKEPSVEQKARALDVVRRLNDLHDTLMGKMGEAHALEKLPDNLTPAFLEFMNELETVLSNCATEADRFRIKIEHERASEDFTDTVQRSRREDLATMIHYLDKVSQQVADLVTTFEGELEKVAQHRQREEDTLDKVDNILKKYGES